MVHHTLLHHHTQPSLVHSGALCCATSNSACKTTDINFQPKYRACPTVPISTLHKKRPLVTNRRRHSPDGPQMVYSAMDTLGIFHFYDLRESDRDRQTDRESDNLPLRQGGGQTGRQETGRRCLRDSQTLLCHMSPQRHFITFPITLCLGVIPAPICFFIDYLRTL